MTPASVKNARSNICAACPAPCAERERLDLTAACAACPHGRWHSWDCQEAASHPPELLPTGFQSAPPSRRIHARLQPGDLLTELIKRMTGSAPMGNCQCAARRVQMNKWGWWGCWTHRQEIQGWLAEEARKRGHTITDAALKSLFVAAWRELLHARGNGHAAAMQIPRR